MDPSVTLWQFLLQLLEQQSNGHLIAWTSDDGEFKLVDAEEVNGQKFVYKFVSYPEPAGVEGAREEGTLRRVEPAPAESGPGEGSSGPPKSLRGGGVPRSSRNEYMRSGLYSTFTIQSLQAAPPGRAPRQDPPALCSEPPDPPDLAPGKVEEIPQLEISIEAADESEPLQVSWPRRPTPELAASQRWTLRAAVPQLPRPSTSCISPSCPQVFVGPEPLDAERPPPEAPPPRDPGLRPVVVKVEAQGDAAGSPLLVLIDSGVKQEAPPAEETPRGTAAELPAGEGPQEEKGEGVPGGAPSEGHGPKGRKPKDLALPSLPGQEKISAAGGSLLAPGGGAGSGLTPTTVISTHALALWTTCETLARHPGAASRRPSCAKPIHEPWLSLEPSPGTAAETRKR
ncbi:hypothetical protein KIL84_001799 [Mauremys mutica]|uniref:ETS domain-containing protein n=1 Tax=Mauremys mutica TaxID=74926 RepID=A0A9D3XKM1_9SAUR|nr:hypothetical protein KIL84_001799 [Mauremys mutica]